ncbi:YdiU family protein [Pacificibacter sp. AS14]|uniref:protein adenylyltransferase SelO n=1 Tax=Pacificibacter sp. AS14 TaxID=3135785 RepID=UPI0031728910
MTQFDNSYARLPDRFFSSIKPEQAPNPEIILFNNYLADDLGVADWATRADILAGNTVPDGAEPLAQVYAAHQFGGWVPRLGDGRAILLGEVVTDHGRFDIQLKGAGRTPYSRNGDGRNWVGPVLREYIVSEFMHAMNVPTTRALAATATGARVQRERAFPGAVITRVASSHIRVGTFQYFTAQRDTEAVKLLIDHVRDRHFPNATGTIGVYEAIIAAQAKLIAKWMGLGFVHGVMNTDNMAVSGETIDYGPCAFIDGYAANAVYSSIDRNGRYAFDQQSNIAGWNLAQLGSSFVPLLSQELGGQEAAVEVLTQSLNAFPALFQAEWAKVFAAKLGISVPQDDDLDLAQELLDLMGATRADFTNVFAGLSSGAARDEFIDRDAFDTWHAKWMARIQDLPDAKAVMRKANPRVIPRTHRLEQAIQAAVEGDFAPAQRLVKVLSTPMDLAEDDIDLTRPPEAHEVVPHTFCGT